MTDMFTMRANIVLVGFILIVATKIVTAIHGKENSLEILSSLYDLLVKPCVKMIEASDYLGAYQLYKTTVADLESIYLNP